MHDDPVGILGGQRTRQGPRVLVHQTSYEVVLDDEGAASRAIRTTSARRSGASTAPVGFWNSGWQTNTRAPVAVKASASRSGFTPSASTGTGTGLRPAARAIASMPGYVGDWTRTGAPGGASALSAVVSADWPPAVTSTSAAVIAPPPIPRANHSRSSVSPSIGGRDQAPGRRPARRRAAHGPLGLERGVRIAAVELDDAGRWGGERGEDPEASTVRGTSSVAASALSVTSCQEVSPAGTTDVRGCARNAPAPGRVTTSPSAAS